MLGEPLLEPSEPGDDRLLGIVALAVRTGISLSVGSSFAAQRSAGMLEPLTVSEFVNLLTTFKPCTSPG